MPIALIVENITLGTSGSYDLPTTTIVDKYIIGGSPTLTGDITIESTGTPSIGIQYNFEWNASVTIGSHSVTIMGVTIPIYLVNKKFQASAYYDGGSWEVQFFPSNDNTGYTPEDGFVVDPYNFLDGTVSTAGVSSTNTTAEETLSSIIIGGNTLRSSGDTLHFIATGSTAANANTKTIRLKSSSAGVIIANATVTAPNNKDWIIEGFICRSTSTNATQVGKITTTGSASDVDITTGGGAYDWTGDETFLITSQCGTGAVGNVVLNSFVAYKLIKSL